eukprot:gene7562-8164_t
MDGSLALFCTFPALTFFVQYVRRLQLDKSKKKIRVSSPGKVLVAGGYLVLETPNIGISISITSRFYATVHQTNDFDGRNVEIIVDSPQFRKQFQYIYDLLTQELSCISKEANAFIETCIRETMVYISQQHHAVSKRLQIFLEADNDFYSFSEFLTKQRLPLTSASLLELPKCAVPDGEEIAKTGLGSSAALTTSLVSGLLVSFGIIQAHPHLTPHDCRIVHNLAQIVHCKAQGKIGSGFDVATAIYGTIAYSRFNPQILENYLKEPLPSSNLLAQLVDSSQLNQKVAPFQLPLGIDIMLGDVSGGSSSVSMAKQVLAWKGENPAISLPLWNRLGEVNNQIYELFEELNKLSQVEASFPDLLHELSRLNASDWSKKKSHNIVGKFAALRELFQDARSLLKYIGELSSVEIEPDSQTALLDATLLIPGVLAAGIPGAGGHDAIFQLEQLSKQPRLSTNFTRGKVR